MDDDRASYRRVMGHLATGVAVVTGHGSRGPGGMTANALCSLSLDPLLVLVCFDNEARTLPIVRESERFAVNVLSSEQRELAHVFASKRGETAKFEGVAYELHQGVPVLAGALAWLVCAVHRLIPAGDHTIAIGEVGAMGHALDSDPLVWYRGEYRTIGQHAPHLGQAEFPPGN
jgi:3-hydroxy-9,10-secoandrosta-1,3,5(10)-triene-9,17-dione monooxygenase reductase component